MSSDTVVETCRALVSSSRTQRWRLSCISWDQISRGFLAEVCAEGNLIGSSRWFVLLKIYKNQVEGTVLVSVRILINKIHTYRLKRWWTTCKAVNCFSNIARVQYLLVISHLHLHWSIFYHVGKICTDTTPTNSHEIWEDNMKAWNYIKSDFDQETGQEYSPIVQIIVKGECGKASAWRSLSCKMKCYHMPDEKNTSNSQSAFCTHSAICSLHFVPGLHFVSGLHSAFCSLQSAFCTNRYPWHQYGFFFVTVISTSHTICHKIPECELIRHFRSFLR